MTSDAFKLLLERMTAAVCRGDGAAAAACFTAHGAYHDGFYGEFVGREAIVDMVENRFHRDARNFEWISADAACDGRTGYARYDFSYVSRLQGSEGKRISFPGISVCELEGDLIRRYSEVFERAQVLVRLGFPDDRILKSIRRWAAEPSSRPRTEENRD
jgi:hypothetical protein